MVEIVHGKTNAAVFSRMQNRSSSGLKRRFSPPPHQQESHQRARWRTLLPTLTNSQLAGSALPDQALRTLWQIEQIEYEIATLNLSAIQLTELNPKTGITWPQPHHNLLTEEAFVFNLPGGETLNLVQLLRQALDNRYGRHNWAMSIGGSLVHLDLEDKLFWPGAGDIDLRIFVPINIAPMANMPSILEEDLKRLSALTNRFSFDIKQFQLDELVARSVLPRAYAYCPFDFYTDSDGTLSQFNKTIDDLSFTQVLYLLLDRYCALYSKRLLAKLKDESHQIPSLQLGKVLTQLCRITGWESRRRKIVAEIIKQYESPGLEPETLKAFIKHLPKFDPVVIGPERLAGQIQRNLINYLKK